MRMRPLHREFSRICSAHTCACYAQIVCLGPVLFSGIPLARTQPQCPAGSVRSVEPGGGIQPTRITNTDDEYLEFRYLTDTYGRGQSEYEVTFAETTTCDVLIVGGGGSGGASIGGGGGAGGVVYIEGVELRPGTHTIRVGRGGAAVDSNVEIYNFPPYVLEASHRCDANERNGSLNQGKDGKSSMVILLGSVVSVRRGAKDIRFEGKGGGGVSFDVSPFTC